MPDDFDDLGFLGRQIDVIMQQYVKEQASLYGVIDQLNGLAMTIKDKVKVNSGDLRAVLAAVLFIKATNCFQAIVLLSKKGLGIECAILTRALLEVTFPLKASSVDEGFAEEFILTEKAKQLKLMKIIQNDKESFSNIHSFITIEGKEALEAEIHNVGIKDISTYEIARRAGMTAFYQLAYRHLSEDVHTTARSLESYVITDEHGDVVMLENGPQHLEVENFKTVLISLLIAIDSMNDIFGLRMDEDIQFYQNLIVTI